MQKSDRFFYGLQVQHKKTDTEMLHKILPQIYSAVIPVFQVSFKV
jgi:hypothetical protein